MNKRVLLYGLAIVLAIAGIGGAVWFKHSGKKTAARAPAVNTPSGSAKGAVPLDNASAKKLLLAILKKAGLKEILQPDEGLQRAITTGDKIQISRAFNDVVYAGWPPDQLISALKTFLNNQNPFVRYLAGQYLFVVGDTSGYDALLALVQSSTPIDGIGQDVRIQAARTLAQFRQANAAQAIYDLYQQTKNGSLISALATLGSPQAAVLTEARGFYSDESSLVFYGKADANKFLSQITFAFQNGKKPGVKTAAAWALATMTQDANAINYINQAAQDELANPRQARSLTLQNTINYLGSIQTPAAKKTLEEALDSSNPAVVQIAALNLVFNQGGSDKVNQMVARGLTSPPTPLGLEMTLDLATQLLSDPQIQAAGQHFSQHEGSGAWQLYTVTRRNWSPYNWMGGIYVANPHK